MVHCYTGNKETAEVLLDMGFSIGITGWICDERRAEALREAVKIIPLDRILLETDAPYLTRGGFPALSGRMCLRISCMLPGRSPTTWGQRRGRDPSRESKYGADFRGAVDGKREIDLRKVWCRVIYGEKNLNS